MALPSSRNRTYVHGATIIEAQDMNELQDYLVTLLSTPIEVFVPAAAGEWYSGGGTVANRAGDLNVAGGVASEIVGVTASLTVEFPLLVPVGFRLREVKAYVGANAASAMFLRLMSEGLAGATKTQRGTMKSSALAATNQTLTIDATSDPSVMPYTVAAGEAMVAQVQFGTTTPSTQKIRGVSFKYSRFL
jgi:hypothetical protein